jgi:hypothetical protein
VFNTSCVDYTLTDFGLLNKLSLRFLSVSSSLTSVNNSLMKVSFLLYTLKNIAVEKRCTMTCSILQTCTSENVSLNSNFRVKDQWIIPLFFIQ